MAPLLTSWTNGLAMALFQNSAASATAAAQAIISNSPPLVLATVNAMALASNLSGGCAALSQASAQAVAYASAQGASSALARASATVRRWAA
ncbi:hypothetical protein H632_c224p1 [Helicosporidium sp. ATCC 50920]|nr:hypothetical protein H632_c224p1 [Helicosporidium sp. ATCC 50920]|eukprot:KDD76443.1 hypothetical protein H632_c224p1 [Helicosporidium sp. ATCC 50920]